MSKFSWIHLSDLHFSANDSLSGDDVRDKLYKKLDDFEDVNYVFITGDVANKSDYKNVETYINRLAESINCNNDVYEKLFWVPGNHDIHRRDERTNYITDIRQSNNPQFNFDKAIDDEYGALLLGKLGYTDYINSCHNIRQNLDLKATVGTHNDELHRIISLPDLNLIEIDTCLLSCNDDDMGNLFVLDKKLKEDFNSAYTNTEVKKMIKEKKPTFVIAHHGREYVHPQEQARLGELFAGKVDLWLCGHSHELLYDKFFDPDKIKDGKSSQTIHQFTCGVGNLVTESSVPTFIYGSYDDGRITVRVFVYKNNNWIEHNDSKTPKQIDFERFKREYRLKDNGFKLFITGVQGVGKTMVSKRLQYALKNSEALQVAEVDLVKDAFRKDILMLQDTAQKHNYQLEKLEIFFEDASLYSSLLETSYKLGIVGIEKQSEYLFPRLIHAIERHTEKGIPAIIEGLNIPVNRLVDYYTEKSKMDKAFDLNSIIIVNLYVDDKDTLKHHIESRIKNRHLTGIERDKQVADLEDLWTINQEYRRMFEKAKIDNPNMKIFNINNSGIEDKDVAVREIIKIIEESRNFDDE